LFDYGTPYIGLFDKSVAAPEQECPPMLFRCAKKALKSSLNMRSAAEPKGLARMG
jgi:hypothetical protein